MQAIGDAAGWWQGDPNSNDGEETFATALGLAGVLVILPLAAFTVTRAGRRARVRPGFVIAGGTLVLLGGLVALVLLVVGV